MLSQDHFIGYVTTTLNNTFANNFETNGAQKLPCVGLFLVFVCSLAFKNLVLKECSEVKNMQEN